MSAEFSFVPVVPPFVGALQEESVVAEYESALAGAGGRRVDPEQLDGASPLVYLVATGGTEGVVMSLRARRAASAPGEPVILIAHPGNNSLPAALEVLARLQQDGERGRVLYLDGPADADGLERVSSAVEDMHAAAALSSARIGMVGDPSDWLVASSPSAETVRAAWGPHIVPIAMEELTRVLAGVSINEVAEKTDSLRAAATDVLEPFERELTDVARVHSALHSLVAEHRLDAVTVRCFDLVVELETTGCFALAELADDGVTAGCEGDIVSTVGMMWARLLTGAIPWMANPAQLDVVRDTLWLAHCTVPRTLVDSYRLRSHFESGIGVGIEGELPRGPVTLLRIGGKQMERLWLAEGEARHTGHAANLCRTQVEVALEKGRVAELLSAPLGNHIVYVYGHHAARLREWWEMYVG